MTPGNVQAVLDLDPATIGKVYSGKPGCGCGCLGTYWTDARNIRRVVKRMQKDADGVNAADGRVGVSPEGIAYVESDTRYLWAYTHDFLSERGKPSTFANESLAAMGG